MEGSENPKSTRPEDTHFMENIKQRMGDNVTKMVGQLCCDNQLPPHGMTVS